MVVVGQAIDAVQVGDHDAAKMPAVAQQSGEQLAVTGGRDAVDAVVGGHDGEGALIDGCLEGREEVFRQVSFADERGISVMTAFRDAVGNEMLEGGGDTFVIAVVQGAGAAHHAGCHPAGQADIFAVGFFHAGPAGLAGQVDDRTVTDMAALGAELGGNDPAGLLHQGRVPG